jgi:ribokinase
VAVVGHIEWVQFARVPELPRAGAVVHATDVFEEPAGGGAVAAVQLARLAGAATLFAKLGRDEHGERSRARLGQLGVRVEAAVADEPTRQAITLVDEWGERTIVTLGRRLEPCGGDALPWDVVTGLDGVYLTAGDAEAVRRARDGARVLVASPRTGEALEGVRLDAVVYSAEDAVERDALARVHPEADLVVATEGVRGGRFDSHAPGGETGRFEAAHPPGPVVDAYGSGDSFAAGLTYGLAAGLGPEQAIALAARCGAVCTTGRGPYGRQLTRDEL